MRYLPLLLLAAACATSRVKHADTFLKHGYSFEGPKWITVVGEGDEAVRFEHLLEQHGFRVSRPIPGVKSELRSRYVINVTGACEAMQHVGQLGNHPLVIANEELKVEAYDSTTSERVFAAHLRDDADCPDAFFKEVSAALNRDWAPALQNASQKAADSAFEQEEASSI